MMRQGDISADCVSRTVWPNLDWFVRTSIWPMMKATWRCGFATRSPGCSGSGTSCAPYVTENYDVVVMDTQGALGGSGSLQSNAALAADLVLFPITPDSQAAAEFFDNTKKPVRNLRHAEDFNVSLCVLKRLIYRLERLTNDRLFAEELRTSPLGVGTPSVANGMTMKEGNT